MTNKGSTLNKAQDDLLTDKEAAKYLGLSEKSGHITLQRWVRKGVLKGGRVGDFYRFKKQDLDDFVFTVREY